MVLKECWESITSKKLITALVILELIVLSFFMSILFLVYQKSETHAESFMNPLDNQNVYQIDDQLRDEKEDAFLSDPANVEKLRVLYEKFDSTDKFKFLNIVQQPIGVIDFKGDQTLLAGYEENSIVEPYKSETDHQIYDTVKAVQVNKQAIDLLNIKLSEGKPLPNEAFKYKENTKIPVLLGSSYRGIYNVGDTITVEYLFKKMNVRVIGFMKENTFTTIGQDSQVYLDRYMVLPMMHFDHVERKDKEFYDFQWKVLLHSVNGYIVTPKDSLKTTKEVNQIASQSGFSDFTIIGANTTGIVVLSSMLEQNQQILILITTTLTLFAMATIYFVLRAKLRLNKKKYGIYLMVGLTAQHILSFIFFEILFLCLISFAVVASIMSLILGTLSAAYYVGGIALSVMFSVMLVVPFYLKFKKHPTQMLLKGRE
ncbi:MULTISPECIES: hypothetical protein [Bacillus amyloliquefaciens group]|mgnify:CR=1 FL=1|uniref:hypothetical protein n=1 Tax=Bacillus amyloliquefaciens group TaxID=1938374 RepID=UPI00104CF874|nr:hypothetical protein [Bacillus velezensis]MCT6684622.1 hypothetical protein [Bacillus velezensis]MCY0092153.1 hypothetical protein [Bacillus velezensis]MEC0383399.1 hypothetical protein [Bacillus velezensis]MEC0386115.1 hypothetical protein [Bacillus velezensis]